MATFYTGNSGGSTGPHLDFRVWDVEAGAWTDPRPHAHILQSDGQSVDSRFDVTSPYGMRVHPIDGGERMHHGIDFGTPENTPITVSGGRYLTTWDNGAARK